MREREKEIACVCGCHNAKKDSSDHHRVIQEFGAGVSVRWWVNRTVQYVIESMVRLD